MNLHSRGNVRQEDYREVGPVYFGPDPDIARCFQRSPLTAAAMLLVREHPHHGHFFDTSRCDSCGARFFYGSVLEHAPTGEAVVVGWECADKVFGFPSRMAYEVAQLRRQTKRAAEVADFLDSHEGLEVALAAEHPISRDLADKLQKYGSLSEKQVALAMKIAAEVEERIARKEREAAEARPVVAGRAVELRGVVLGARVEEGDFGDTLKMLFRDDRGFKAWGTCPAAARGGEVKGLRLSFVADVEASQKDPCFGFFRRPRKVQIEEATSDVPVVR